jgi:hypothetical protein
VQVLDFVLVEPGGRFVVEAADKRAADLCDDLARNYVGLSLKLGIGITKLSLFCTSLWGEG